MSLNSTPSSERTHIGIFGKRNAGKSSLINAMTGQSLAIVSDVKGTTTDPVLKSMELLPLGPVVIIDTPGLHLLGNSISTIYEDSNGTLWVGSGLSGLYRINFEKEEMVTYHKGNSILTSNSVRAISELRGMLLIGTFDGLYTIDL